MVARAQSRRKIEIDLRDAIQNDVLRPYYQPLINLSTGHITGFEALVPWPPPERGRVSPAELIPVAEETGLIKATLHALRALGVRISMDDFGTGYSSLSYLRSFTLDKIKIDQSFVRDLGSNR